MGEGWLHDYPVDPVGYADRRPDPGWPGGANWALQLTILAADPLVPRGPAVQPVSDAPEQAIARARRAGISTGRDRAYGCRVGLYRLRRLLRRSGLPATWFFAASLAERLPDLVRHLATEGDEIALLGDSADLAAGPAAVADLRQRLDAVCGAAPVGWRSRRRHPDGRKVLVRAGGFLYDGDAADDDLPYWQHAAGSPLLVLPAAPLASAGAAGLARALACAAGEAADRPQLLRLELQPGRLGRPDEADLLAESLARLAARTDLWVAPACAIARHWRQRHPFAWASAAGG